MLKVKYWQWEQRGFKRHLFSKIKKIPYNKKINRRLNMAWFVADLEKLDNATDCYRELEGYNIIWLGGC